jgi:PRTRC genetic system ThiF family protein
MPKQSVHRLKRRMLTDRISIAVVGCGGTGSAVLSGLPYLHHAMVAAGHPRGIKVCAIDGDRVSESNCVRQPFTSSEVGLYKVHVLMQRLNVFWGLDWIGIPTHVRYGRDVPDADFVISCVDTRAARHTVARIVRLKSRRFPYWLDLGNNASSGQFVLGEPLRPNRKGTAMRLRCVDELYPQIVAARLDARDNLPSCSAAESLIRQEPYVNSMLAQHALAMLARLFRHGEIAYHGGFVSQETGRVNPLPVDRNTWAWIQTPRQLNDAA